jgi:mannan endo-1,4-beta-mannosidase
MRIRVAASAAAVAAVIAGCAASPSAVILNASPSAPAASSSAPAALSIPAVPGSLPGVYESSWPQSYAAITAFGNLTGEQPKVALYYSAWGEGFKAQFAGEARQHGAYVLAQLQPNGVTLASVAAGGSDAYLRRYAAQVRAFGHPVILSFAHEMNGGWYGWGTKRNTPAQFIAAWRHVVGVFRVAGATNVTWLWAVNAVNAGETGISRWWPGAAWVDWVGIDGYYYFPADRFSGVFGTTIAEVRRFTTDPVFIGETAIGPGPDAAAQVADLFAGMRADRVLGFAWFDHAQDDPPYHQDWKLSDDPAALAAFRAAVGTYTETKERT